jgi:hypothetical protein
VEQVFDLHRAVQTSLITDIYKPIGGWKLEPNLACHIARRHLPSD